MGISIFGTSRCKCDGVCSEPVKGNPDPSNFEIVKTAACKGMLIAMLQYPDCDNYEGLKIMVYEDVSEAYLRLQRTIDPHFCKGPHCSPVARFEPTDRGWKMAKAFCRAWKI